MDVMSTMPTYEANSFIRWLAEATERYFENPSNQEEFEKWKKEREQSAEQ